MNVPLNIPNDDKTDDEDYDPYEHRTSANPMGNFAAWLHIVKAIMGTGLLAMPEAFKNAGLCLGVAGSLVNGGLCTYGIHLLMGSQYLLCKKIRVGSQTYAESMVTAFELGPRCSQKFSKYARGLTEGFFIASQVGACCVYILFIGSTIKIVIDGYLPKPIPIELYFAMMFMPVFVMSLPRDLKSLLPFSMVANIISIIMSGVVFYYIFSSSFPPISDRLLFAPLYRLPLFFGTTNFAFQAVVVVSSIEYHMKTPKSFRGYFGVYNRALALLAILYIALGFCGYLKYGEETKASITINMPPREVIIIVVNLMYAFAIFASYNLHVYTPVQLIWNSYIGKYLTDSRWPVVWEYLLRLAIVIVSFVFPVSVPMLGICISFIGSVCISMLVYIFPGWMDICARYQDRRYGACRWRMWKDILVIIYGFIGMITGIFVTFLEIFQYFKK